MTMRISDVRFDAPAGRVSLLVEYGWGGGYAQASRFWHCRDIKDAMSADISEVHEEWVRIGEYEAGQIRRLAEGGTIPVSEMQHAFESDSAQTLLIYLASALGIKRDHLSLAKLGRAMTLADITDRLVTAARKSLHAAATA